MGQVVYIVYIQCLYYLKVTFLVGGTSYLLMGREDPSFCWHDLLNCRTLQLRPYRFRTDMPKRKAAAPKLAPDNRAVGARGHPGVAGQEADGKENTKFPNLSVIARQYLGCPASSATVERLFSQVGIAFSDRRKNASAETIADIIFTKLNVE